MDMYTQLLFICPLTFFAGVVDAIAGGGGIITLPAYIAAGVPPHFALGTNKFAAAFGTSVSVWRFTKNKKTHFKAALISAVSAMIGSPLGSKLALVVSDKTLKLFLLITLPLICVFVIKNKLTGDNTNKQQASGAKLVLLCVASGFFIGGYDGFSGPGTGTFLIIIFNAVIGFDLLTASGNAKIVNLSSNVASLATFLAHGNVLLLLGIPAAICSVAGNFVGSHLALTKGAKIIRPAFVFVLTLLLIKVAYDLFGLAAAASWRN